MPDWSAAKQYQLSHPIDVITEGEVVDRDVGQLEAMSRRREKLINSVVSQVTRLLKKDVYDLFGKPVDEEVVPGYSAVVTKPMDFGTIVERLKDGQYEDLGVGLSKKEKERMSKRRQLATMTTVGY